MTDSYPYSTHPPEVDTEHTVADGPLVSIVIPTHYRNDRLRAAIDSALAQRYEPIEVLVVDDSGDRHAEPVVAEYPAVQYRGLDRNRGSNAARTIGLSETDGTYVQFLDDDDRLRVDKIDRQVALLERDPDVGVAYCGMRYEDGGRRSPDPAVRGDVLEQALAFELMPCVTTTMLSDRDLLEAFAPFENRPGADDFPLMIELARRTEFDFVDDLLVIRGVIDGSRGKSMGVFHGRMELFEAYDALYAEFPESVKRRALADTYAFRGSCLLEDRLWSPRAVVAFARAFRYRPGVTPAGRTVASLFGSPGLAAALALRDRVAGSPSNG